MHPPTPDLPPPAPPMDQIPPADPDIEAVLRDPVTLWETLWHTTGEYVAVVDRAGIIRACNRVADGFTPDQVIGHSVVRFTVPESSVVLTEMLQQVFTDGGMRTLETTVRRLDGELSFFSLRIAPIHLGGRTAAALVCCENIRPLKDTERALTHERHVLRQLLEIQERERQLVSYEIHDGLSQYLAGAMMHLQSLETASVPVAERRELGESLRLLRAAVDESRRLISGLRPPALDELGIVDAVESLVEDARLDIRSVIFTHDVPTERMAAHLETGIFRIIQESLSNARRHSRASSVSVVIAQVCRDDARRIRVSVRDDGIGFDPARVPEDRFGLEGIRQRSMLLGGHAVIRSEPGRGTSIDVDLPWVSALG